jgi:hypothetical protein
MNKKSVFQVLLYISIPFVCSNSQNLLFPKNSLEYMCVPLQSLSDFDNSNNFVTGADSFLVDGQPHLSYSTLVTLGGVNNTKCLKIQPTTSPFPSWGGTFYLQSSQQPSINTSEGVGVWMKATKDTYVNFYFQDATGMTFFVPKKVLDGNADWEYTYALPDSYRNKNNASSTANPAIQYPCKFLGFGFQTLEEGTAIYVDDASKIQEHDRTQNATIQTSPKKIANVYSLGESISATVTSASTNLKVIIKNYKGDIIGEKTGDKTIQLQLPTSTIGYYEILVLSYKDKIDATNLTSAGMFCYGVIDDKVVYNEILGVCTHPQRAYYSKKSVDLMPIIGAKYMRFELALEDIDKSEGKFKNKNGEDILSAAEANGCKFICILRDKTPPLTDTLKAKFLNYSRFVLNKYRNSIKKVELWNEWSHGTGTYSQYKSQQTASNYVDFVSSIYPTLKSEYPDVEFIGLGGENPQRFRDNILKMFQTGAGKYMDAISLHPYRQPNSPDSRTNRVHKLTVDEQVKDIIDIAKTYNSPQKVYVTEIGQPGNMTTIGKNDLTQAQYMIKILSLLITSNVVENIAWYNLYDMDELNLPGKYTKKEEYEQYHFGLFNGTADNHAVKTSAMAYRFFAKATSGYGESKRYDNGNGFFRLTFIGKTSGELDIVWNSTTPESIPVPTGTTAYDLMGNVIKNKGYIMLGREPVYLDKSPLK